MAFYRSNGERITDPAKIAQLNKCRRRPVPGFKTLTDYLENRDEAVREVLDQPAHPFWRVPLPVCKNFGLRTNERAECIEGCAKGTRLIVYGCEEYGTCTQGSRGRDVPGCCREDCPKYEPI